jgi:hypothetical protein
LPWVEVFSDASVDTSFDVVNALKMPPSSFGEMPLSGFRVVKLARVSSGEKPVV